MAKRVFANEAGGHRFQRIPPTEKRGRVQTSTITVAVLGEVENSKLEIDEKDLEYKTRRGSGPGGQHKNTTDSCVDLKHIPTGLSVSVDGRSQGRNRTLALQILRGKLEALNEERGILQRNEKRKSQVGCGMRGDKRRTIRVEDGHVTDHILGRKIRYKDYIKGNLDDILKE